MAKKLTIGIVDGLFYSLQGRLLAEGHKVKVFLPYSKFSSPIPSGDFNSTPVAKSKNLVHATRLSDLYDCDYVICEATDREGHFETLRYNGVPVVGHSMVACLLEKDRALAKTVIQQNVISGARIKGFRIPETHEFTDLGAVKDFLSKTNKKWVIKQSPNSPKESTHPTKVIEDPHTFVNELDKPNPWFEEGEGGCIIEQKIEGQEVCFGAWFNGRKFILPMYSCIEHKGAQNGDRGAVLTGEVGTTLHMHTDAESRMVKVFQSLESVLEGECVGMIDINTILTENGDQYFLEFTIRFGRPTLEMMIAKMNNDFNLGDALLALIIGSDEQAGNAWKNAYRPGFSVGVTIFTYGYPVLDTLIESAPEELREKLEAALPNYQSKVAIPAHIDVQPLNKDRPTSCAHLLQFMAAYSPKEKLWALNGSDRHFIAVGHHLDHGVASSLALGLANNIHIDGCTHRDDVGAKLGSLTHKLIKHRIV